MKPIENMEDFRSHLMESMKAMTNDELVTVLKRRKQYQPDAEVMAVNEALRRGLIQSEADLDTPAFSEPRPGFTLFPCPEEKEAADKLFKSLMRSLMIVGLIPVVFGVMKFMFPKHLEGTALISLGILWLAFAWFAMEKRLIRLLYPILVLTLLSMIYAARMLLVIKYLKWSDILIPVVLYMAIFYLIFYARSILRRIGQK